MITTKITTMKIKSQKLKGVKNGEKRIKNI